MNFRNCSVSSQLQFFILSNIIIGVIVIIAFFVLKRITEISILYKFNKLTEEDFDAVEQQCEKDRCANQMWEDFANKYPDFMETPFDSPENRTEKEIDIYLDEEDRVLEEIRAIEKDSDTFWK